MRKTKVDFSYLRPMKAKQLRQWYTDSFECKSELEVLDLDEATILPLRHYKGDHVSQGRGGVVDIANQYVDLSGIEGRIYGKYDYEQSTCDSLDETVLFCGYLTNHWGHFLIESIPRLWYALEHPEFEGRLVFFTDEGKEVSLKGNFLAFFDLLGLTDRVLIINRPTRCNKAIIPELSYSRICYYSNHYNLIFDRIIENCQGKNSRNSSEFPEKIFLSRSKFARKKPEIGMDFLDDYFEKNGYKIIFPEECSLEELVLYMKHAKKIAAESGSGAHNFLFVPQNSDVEVVERQALPNEIQANIDVIRSLHTVYIDAHYALYPTDASGGPFFIYYTPEFERYTKDTGMIPPDKKYISKKYGLQCTKKYIKQYHKRFGERLNIQEWMLMYSESTYEVAKDTENTFEYAVMSRKQKIKYWLSKIKNIDQILPRSID